MDTKSGKFQEQVDTVLVSSFSGTFGIAGVGIIGWQIFRYLKDGDWPAVSLITALQWMGVEKPWVSNPTEWVGLHSVMDTIPLSLTLVVLAIFTLMAGE